ncbi:FAS1-like dehydratase domain-containing protein [Domibacillus epiphyticus]|nr:MaoC family dehydratase N-terminal domain-containing protein [Domibacillus epiphyticus]
MKKEEIELHRYSHTIDKKQVETFKHAIREIDSSNIVPPTYATVIDFQGGMSFDKLTELLEFDPKCVLHGSQQYEYISPIFTGDTIDASVFLTSKTTKRGMTFAKLETKYMRNGECVIISRSTLIEQKGDRNV